VVEKFLSSFLQFDKNHGNRGKKLTLRSGFFISIFDVKLVVFSNLSVSGSHRFPNLHDSLKSTLQFTSWRLQLREENVEKCGKLCFIIIENI
jgi:hypothetical protein